MPSDIPEVGNSVREIHDDDGGGGDERSDRPRDLISLLSQAVSVRNVRLWYCCRSCLMARPTSNRSDLLAVRVSVRFSSLF